MSTGFPGFSLNSASSISLLTRLLRYKRLWTGSQPPARLPYISKGYDPFDIGNIIIILRRNHGIHFNLYGCKDPYPSVQAAYRLHVLLGTDSSASKPSPGSNPCFYPIKIRSKAYTGRLFLLIDTVQHSHEFRFGNHRTTRFLNDLI